MGIHQVVFDGLFEQLEEGLDLNHGRQYAETKICKHYSRFLAILDSIASISSTNLGIKQTSLFSAKIVGFPSIISTTNPFFLKSANLSSPPNESSDSQYTVNSLLA